MAQPLKGEAYEFFTALTDFLDPSKFVINPTVALGDFKISKEGGAFANLLTTPVVSPAGSLSVKINLSALEMTADKIVISAKDASGDQWKDLFFFVDAPTGNQENIIDILEGDHKETNTDLEIFKKGTTTLVLKKKITGSLLSPSVTVETKEP